MTDQDDIHETRQTERREALGTHAARMNGLERKLQVCWTIAISSRYVPWKKGKYRNFPYGRLPPMVQIHWLKTEYLPSVVDGFLPMYYGVFELTKEGNVHMHLYGVMYSVDPEWDLNTLRRLVGTTTLVSRITKCRPDGLIHLNHIVRLTKPYKDWEDYCMKVQKDIPADPVIHGKYIPEYYTCVFQVDPDIDKE